VPITSLKFRPGINKETTSYSNKGGWNDCDLVRFRFGYPEKLGGWEKYSGSTFLGTSRSLHAWANLEGNKYLGVGTEQKFYIEESQGYNDITPLRRKVVSGEVVFDLGGLTVTAATSGNAGTSQVGTVVVDPEQVVSVKSTNPENNLRILGTTAVGTVTVEAIQRPITANLFATGQIGTVTVEDTRNETISVG
tara:strand:+ start:2508 stop:3086 length:579 start_codon:yes stop_codon:yes gene_type:complete